jgi:ribonuclease PH
MSDAGLVAARHETTLEGASKERALRIDGRSANDLRGVRLVPDFTENPLASVLCEMGRTRVMCTVSEETSVPRFLRGTGKGWLTSEYSLLPGSTDTRAHREVSRGRPSGRTLEIQRLIGRSLRAVTDLSALGERTLWVDCDVLQADGGTRCASITGAYAALAVAVNRLVARGDLARNPLRDSVAAVSVGIVGNEVMLDLCYEEDSRANVDMNVVATGAGRFVEVQGTGEESTFSTDELRELTTLALQGIAELAALQKQAIDRADATR